MDRLERNCIYLFHKSALVAGRPAAWARSTLEGCGLRTRQRASLVAVASLARRPDQELAWGRPTVGTLGAGRAWPVEWGRACTLFEWRSPAWAALCRRCDAVPTGGRPARALDVALSVAMHLSGGLAGRARHASLALAQTAA